MYELILTSQSATTGFLRKSWIVYPSWVTKTTPRLQKFPQRVGRSVRCRIGDPGLVLKIGFNRSQSNIRSNLWIFNMAPACYKPKATLSSLCRETHMSQIIPRSNSGIAAPSLSSAWSCGMGMPLPRWSKHTPWTQRCWICTQKGWLRPEFLSNWNTCSYKGGLV